MDWTHKTDSELMAMIQTGNPEAFDALGSRYAQPLLRHLQSIVHNPDLADDLLQEALLRLWTSAEQWDGRGSVKAWLYRLTTNPCLNSLRTAAANKHDPLTDLDSRLFVGLAP